MQIWSHTYLRRGCGAALITMAAVQAGISWREPSPDLVALEPLPPLQLLATAQDEQSVVPVQFAAVNPASRNHRGTRNSQRLPPVQSAATPRRLPPVSDARVARRLPSVPTSPQTAPQFAATIEPKSSDVILPPSVEEIGLTSPGEESRNSSSLTLAAPQLGVEKAPQAEKIEVPITDKAKSASAPPLTQPAEIVGDRMHQEEVSENSLGTSLARSVPQSAVSDVARSGDRPQRSQAKFEPTSDVARSGDRPQHSQVKLEPTSDVSAVLDVARSGDRPQRSRLDPNDPLSLIPNPLQPEWKKAGSALSIADRQADELVRNAATLARRGATYSSRRELESALVVLAQALDSHYGTTGFTQCLHRGLLALEEAGDFAPGQARGQLNLDVSLIVSRHRSGVVAADETTTCTPAEIVRKYEIFAQEHLAAACGNSPLAAHALFGMGKVYSKMSEDSAKGRQFGQRAMLLHQTALKVDGTHSPAATELGTLLARSGRLQEAREVLIQGLSSSKSPEAWRQLADVHAQLGENLLANQARVEAERIAQVTRHANPNTVIAPNGTAVKWVDVATFQRVGLVVPPSQGMLSENRLQQPSSSPTAKSQSSEIPRTATQPRRLIRSW